MDPSLWFLGRKEKNIIVRFLEFLLSIFQRGSPSRVIGIGEEYVYLPPEPRFKLPKKATDVTRIEREGLTYALRDDCWFLVFWENDGISLELYAGMEDILRWLPKTETAVVSGNRVLFGGGDTKQSNNWQSTIYRRETSYSAQRADIERQRDIDYGLMSDMMCVNSKRQTDLQNYLLPNPFLMEDLRQLELQVDYETAKSLHELRRWAYDSGTTITPEHIFAAVSLDPSARIQAEIIQKRWESQRIGVDLDGTLAYYDGWKGSSHIGEPIPAMVERVKNWLA